MVKLAEREEYWYQYPSADGYPPGIVVCPLCGLPETEGQYFEECDCWDGDEEETDG